MDNRTSTSLDEKNTSPSLPTPTQQPADDDDAFRLASGPLSQSPLRSKRRRGSWLSFFRGYGAALVMGLPVLPVVVSAVTIVVYLSNSSISGWVSIVSGAASTYIAWLLVSLLFVPLTSPRNANSRSYGLLESRFQQLQTRLYTVRNEYPDEKGLQEYQRIALNEAYDKLQEISEDVDDSNTRLTWAMGYGYVNSWSMLHRAEEALVEVEPLQVTLRGAMHDKMAISGSQMSNRDELLAKLLYAAKKLDPSLIGLFKPLAVPAPPEENESPEIQQLEQDVQQIADHIGLKLGKGHAATPTRDNTHNGTHDGTQSSDEWKDEARGRLTLREVRRALNDYRDHLWEGLLRARNNLLAVTFVTGLGTHILLCIAILALPLNASSHAIIIAAASYYMLGAIAGLFGRIGQATLSNIAVDDYGLTLAQVMSRPLYSGLAGLGGVLLSSTVLGFNTSNSVQSVFTSVRVDYLIVAAAFGLTPNLIAGGLQNQSNKLLSALRASKTTISDKSASNDDGQNAGN
ncbi:MAG TPA: hypothetical protein VIZ18_00665 [Ktedonobacteraceae bacterium]